MVFSKRSYDVAKYLAQIVLPALATLYYTVAQIWGLPNATEVVGTITGIDAFLGIVLQVSSSSYNKEGKYDGSINVLTKADGGKMFSLEITSDPETLDQKSEILFKVAPKTEV